MLADRIKETSTTVGTGTYSLAGAASGFRTFVAGIGTGNTCHYVAQMGPDWEVGIGTVTDLATDTLSRTTIIASSNANAAVNWAGGEKTIFCDQPARNIAPVRHNYVATVAPTTSNDSTQGYGYGSLWVDTVAQNVWMCVDPFATGATWTNLGSATRIKQASAGGGTIVGQAATPDTDSTIEATSVSLAKYAASNVTGIHNVILGGGAHVSAEPHCAMSGVMGRAKHRGSRVHGFGRTTVSYTNAGEHQYERAGWAGQTTGATATELFLSDTTTPAARLVIPTDAMLYFTVRVAAIRSDGAQGAAYKVEGAVLRDGAAAPVFVGTPTTTVIGESDAAWDFALAIDATNFSLKPTVTGVAATTINWTATIEAVQAAFAPT